MVRLPRADIKPLQVMMKQGNDLTALGELSELLLPQSGIPLPPISPDQQAANVSGQRTGNLSLGIGLTLLGSILNAMGGSKLGLDAKYQQARSLSFEFDNVLENIIDAIALDKFLATATIDPNSRHVTDLLYSDALYITAATIKSDNFTVEAKKSDGTSLSLDIPTIQQVVGANVKVAAKDTENTKISYQGTVPLVFGFQGLQLFYQNDHYSAFRPVPPELMRRGGPQQQQPELLTTETLFVRF
jgi:hypothetical protein